MNKFLFVIISLCFILHANSQTIDFTFESTNGLYCNPATVLFKQTCTGKPVSFIWSFGNNLYSDQPIASSSYTSAGIYTVKLIAIFEKTALELSKTIVINPAVTANILFDKNFICQPGTINFSDSGSSNIKNYEWNFGDGTAVVNTTSNSISHLYKNFGASNVTLKATAGSGCSDTASTIITIKNFALTGRVSAVRGCIPATIKFTGNTTLPANSTVASYIWDFGDGSPTYTSTVNIVSHTYSSVGNNFPTLTVITNEGCTNTFKFPRLYFGTPPTNHVGYALTSSVCGSDSAVFITKATNANRYFWNFGDGTSASSTDTIIKHKYNSTGIKTLFVNAYYNECEASSINFKISVIGVVAKYAYANTCSNKSTYSFSDTSSGIPTSSLWDFSNGVQQANVVNAIHSFPTSGQFTTTLYLTDTVSGCRDSISKEIYTATPDLYSPDSSVCRNSPVSFSILKNYTDTAARYTWNVVGSQIGPVANASFTDTAYQHGSFNNFVVINYGLESCPDTINLNRAILVKGPNPDFTAPAAICLNKPLMVTNNSRPFIPADSLKIWYWNFGDSNNNEFVFEPAPHQYSMDSSYAVRLTAIDKNGCEDTLSKIIVVNPKPFLHILPAKAVLCFGQSVTMFAYHNNDIVWSPSNSLSCTVCDTTVASPLVSARYYVTATNTFNCSVLDSNYIEVAIPFTATITPADVYLCRDGKTFVDVNPKGKKILWSPKTGLSNPTIYNPVITGLNNTTYTATLSDSTGCLTNSSSADLRVHLIPPPLVNAGPDKFYLKGTSFFFTPTYGSNVISYLWTPSVLLNCNSCAAPNGVAMYSQKYVVKVTSDSGCVASDSVTISVDCKSAVIFMPKAFTPNNDNLNDLFYPTSFGIKSISKFTIYNRQGRIVHEARNFSPNNKSVGWNGNFKGAQQNMDTYVYIIEAICETGESVLKKGSFLLLR